jgi:hypothetical protein
MEQIQQELPQLAIDLWKTPKEVAGHFGLKEDSAYRWMDDGTIEQKYIKYCGRWRMRLHPEVIPILEKIFISRRQ